MDATDFPSFSKAKAKNSGKPDAWTDPVDFLSDRDTSAPQLKEQHVPPSLWPFIADTAERLGVATSCVALASIVSCAAAISEEWQIQPKRHDYTWTEAARLWGAIVGPPAILKSPVIAITTAPIVDMEVAAKKNWHEQMAAHHEALTTWKAAGKEDVEPTPPRRQRYLVENVTIEALQEVLRDDQDGKQFAPLGKVLCRQDELSEFIAGMDRYSTGGKGSDRGAYLRSYNGGRFSIDRIGRGSFAARSWSVCLLGGIQPEPIQHIAAQAVDDGLLQRMMLDVPPLHGTGKDRTPDIEALDTYRSIFPALAALRPAHTLSDPSRPVAVVLHADAHAAREDIDVLARVLAAMPNTSPRLQSTFGKWSGLFARLALTFHLVEFAAAKARGDRGPVPSVVSADIANRVGRYMREILAPNLLRAEAIIFATKQADHASWIAHYILAKRLDRVAARDIVQDYRQLRAPEQRDTLNNTMDSLCTLGWLAPILHRNEAKPPVAWWVNPAVHVAFAERARAERDRRVAVRDAIAKHAASMRETVDNVA